jgi:hypothetical protein
MLVIDPFVEQDSILQLTLYPIIGFFLYYVYVVDSLAELKQFPQGLYEGVLEYIKEIAQAILKIVKKIKKELE